MKTAWRLAKAASSAPTGVDRWLVGRLRQHLSAAPIQYELWDGFQLRSPAGPPVATVQFKSRSALLACLRNPDLNFGEGYMSGAIEVQGDLLAFLEVVYRALDPSIPRGAKTTRSNDLRSAEHNVHHHYDLGNAFYRLWLDSAMVYTCAYFPTPEASLEQAQIAKMDLICRKLNLRSGDRVVEAGCGWGALALHMAEHYGVTVRAFNVSAEQIAYARERAARSGLSGRVEFIADDYRNVSGPFDVFVSIGMLEHVGRDHYPTLGEVIDRGLEKNGRGLLHFIGRNRPAPLNDWIRKRIFPGAYAPTLREVCEGVLEPRGFSVLDVENLRLHYAKTLEWWRRRFGAAESQVQAMFDETFVRAWRLYLAGSQAAFVTGVMQLFQVVFARSENNDVPWVRVSN
jgi:cyclopropane-fatty-acyl-phospholipid synthase